MANRDAAEVDADIVARGFVVIARHVDDLRALAHLAQHLLDHIVVQLVPVPAAPQLPPVDDVADEIQIVGLGAAQEFEQRGGLAAGRAQVAVGNEDGAKVPRGHRRRPIHSVGARHLLPRRGNVAWRSHWSGVRVRPGTGGGPDGIALLNFVDNRQRHLIDRKAHARH